MASQQKTTLDNDIKSSGKPACGRRRNSNARRTAYEDQRETANMPCSRLITGTASKTRVAMARTNAQQNNV